MKIKEMTENERPREKMILNGPEMMSNGELLAILIGWGTKGVSAVDAAQNLLKLAEGSLTRLSQMTLQQIQTIHGLGGVKAVTVEAALELGRRFVEENMRIEKTSIISPAQVYNMMRPVLKGLTKEECWVVFLNSANYVIAKKKMSTGGLNATLIDIKAISVSALEKKAVSVILVHNHPSGNPRPGTEDLRQTGLLKQALTSLSIDLMDHIVVCDDSYFSFADDTLYSA